MATLPVSKLVTHPEGTINLGGLINANWETLEAIFDPATTNSSPVYGVILAALRGQGQQVETLTYAATVDLDFQGAGLQFLDIDGGDVTFAFDNHGVGRSMILLLTATGADRDLTWPAGMKWSGSAPATIEEDDSLMVLLYSFDTDDANVWGGVPGGGGGGGPGGDGTPAGLAYLFNTATSGDPSAGKLLLNNGTVASSTVLHISETDADTNGIAALLATWDDADNPVRGTLIIRAETDPTIWAAFQISGDLTDAGSYNTFPITHVASAGTFTNDLAVRVEFSRSGDEGAVGSSGATASIGIILAIANGNFLP